ncbi:hypothetical protein [Bradyrhizobium archetypum]|uniref:Uncharacterized protein n=1 Tax=Bradyrhizobium archetypum TaxID=2721160 RepID=A0A7Y4H0M2_9BRAD|nr:hypothetical protein [Bradyrhizobium archetypum]NOJ44712.1 hypothetical protein [Bradyrhizobium archetypum]
MTAKRKGDLLEDLVAIMHEVPGVFVEKRKKLPVLNSKTRRRREIDVLITSDVADTADAQDAAKSRGIKTLVFAGLTSDRLRQEINAAIQSMVFLLIRKLRSPCCLTSRDDLMTIHNSSARP